MAQQKETNFNFVNCTLLLLLSLFYSTVCSESSGQYIEYLLENKDICHPLGIIPLSTKLDKSITDLRNLQDKAIIVKPAHLFDRWHVRSNMTCKFRIKGPKNGGLFAVIESMSLRVNGTECIDYIRFIPEIGRSSPKFCGKLDFDMHQRRQQMYFNEDESLKFYETPFFETADQQGKITTEIFISKQPLNLLEKLEKLDLMIVYTPYRDCRPSSSHDVELKPLNSKICINNKFFCDGYINCASFECLDEANCTIIKNEDYLSGSKLTVTAMSTIFLIFIIFILCLWICKKYNVLCWSPDCAGPSSASAISGSVSGLRTEFDHRSAQNTPYVASAPMLEVTRSSNVQDKDLPPSYDSLFPTQNNAASS